MKDEKESVIGGQQNSERTLQGETRAPMTATPGV